MQCILELLSLLSLFFQLKIGDGSCVLAFDEVSSSGFGPSWVLGATFIRTYCNIYDIGNERIGFQKAIHSALPDSTTVHSTSVYRTSVHSTSVYRTSVYSTFVDSTPVHSTSVDSTPVYSTSLHSTRHYPTWFQPTPYRSTLNPDYSNSERVSSHFCLLLLQFTFFTHGLINF